MKSDDSSNSAASTRTFGTAFGELIRQKRGQEGLTQKQLAELAFGDETKARRIIELETGGVSRPHASTVDPLIVYFDISDSELQRCREHGLFSPEERVALGLPRDLLENLALRFEIADPDAGDDELVDFLKSKAKELKEIKIRLGQIDGALDAVRTQIEFAEEAIEQGDFSKAEEFLASAEETQQESQTLNSIGVQVEIRMARADAALMNGNSPEAAGHYIKAARYFTGFSITRTADVLAEGAGRIYEKERRARRPSFMSAIPLAEEALALTPRDDVSSLFLRSYQFAMLLLTQGRTSKEKKLVDDAEKVLLAALKEHAVGVDNYDLNNAKIVLGNIYLQRAEMGGRGTKSSLNKARLVYEECILEVQLTGQAMQLCHLHNNVATIYRHLAQDGDPRNAAANLKKAREHLWDAVRISGENGEAEVWASAQYNLGGALAEEASLVDAEAANFYRVQAIAAYTSSMEAYPQTAVNWQLAKCNLAVGRVLFDHALQSQGGLQEVYLIRSIQHSEIAANMYSSSPKSVNFAICHFQVGVAFYVHSKEALPKTAMEDLERALSNFEKCLSILDGREAGDLREKCVEAIRNTKDAMQAVPSPA